MEAQNGYTMDAQDNNNCSQHVPLKLRLRWRYDNLNWWIHNVFFRKFRMLWWGLKQRISEKAIRIVVRLNSDSGYIKHFDKESRLKDGSIGCVMYNDVIELLSVLATQGHSGYSIGILRNLFLKASGFELLRPLTFEDDEWSEIREYGSCVKHQQNLRKTSVFKDEDGKLTDGDSILISVLPYRYEMSTNTLEKYDYPGLVNSGWYLLYNKKDGSYHRYKAYISNTETYMGENYIKLPALELYDKTDRKNDFYVKVAFLDSVPENFYDDYELVADENGDVILADEIKYCKEHEIHKVLAEAIKKSKQKKSKKK